MIQLLIIADDFTGALDTGVQFAKKGIATRVTTSLDFDCTAGEAQVLVLDAETRHLPQQEAYDRVYAAARRSLEQGVRRLYKKTDSGLRGNVGAELEGMLAAAGQNTLYFAPAFPRMDRVTRDGIHFISGTPLAESVFGRDPFEPVRHSSVAELIGLQSSVLVEHVAAGSRPLPDTTPRICLFDAWKEEHLRAAVEAALTGELQLLAGCAGLAEHLADALEGCGAPRSELAPRRGLLVLSGSVNQITLGQLLYARENGFSCLRLTPAQKLGGMEQALPALLAEVDALCGTNSRVAVCTALCAEDVAETDAWAQSQGITAARRREIIADGLGALARGLLLNRQDCVVAFVGGDTLLSAMEKLAITDMTPIDEVAPGIVLAEISKDAPLYVATKSGGFGGEDALLRLADELTSRGCLEY